MRAAIASKSEVDDAIIPLVKKIGVEVELTANPKLVVGVYGNEPAAVMAPQAMAPAALVVSALLPEQLPNRPSDVDPVALMLKIVENAPLLDVEPTAKRLPLARSVVLPA